MPCPPYKAIPLREATTLQVTDILSDRGLVHIHAGKGAMDRMIPLPKITLLTLRKYYKTHRNPQWIFPALGRNGGKNAQFASGHKTLQSTMVYLHVTTQAQTDSHARITQVMQGVLS
jgi:integrase